MGIKRYAADLSGLPDDQFQKAHSLLETYAYGQVHLTEKKRVFTLLIDDADLEAMSPADRDLCSLRRIP